MILYRNGALTENHRCDRPMRVARAGRTADHNKRRFEYATREFSRRGDPAHLAKSGRVAGIQEGSARAALFVTMGNHSADVDVKVTPHFR
jgi:hypothetical protein